MSLILRNVIKTTENLKIDLHKFMTALLIRITYFVGRHITRLLNLYTAFQFNSN